MAMFRDNFGYGEILFRILNKDLKKSTISEEFREIHRLLFKSSRYRKVFGDRTNSCIFIERQLDILESVPLYNRTLYKMYLEEISATILSYELLTNSAYEQFPDKLMNYLLKLN